MSDSTLPISIHHDSYWTKQTSLGSKFPRLTSNHKTQVAVVGAGLTGLSTALELLNRGYQVTVLESSVIGSGTTGGSTGHVEAMPEIGVSKLIQSLGEAKARDYIRYRLEGIDLVEQRSTVECDFQRISGYHFSENLSELEKMQEERLAASSIGLITCWHDHLSLPFRAYGFEIKHMGRVHCMNFLRAMTNHVVSKGGRIFENSLVKHVSDDHPNEVKAGDGSIQFDHIVYAVHSGYTDALRVYFQTPAYQSYALTAEVAGQVSDALYWDTTNPYYYIRKASSPDASYVIVGGRDHRTGFGDPEQALDELKGYLYARFDVKRIMNEWSAELFEPSDGMPIIGLSPGKKNVWIATGLSGIGWTLGPIAGQILARQIDGETVPLQDEFAPSRFGLGGITSTIAEQTLSAGNYMEKVIPAERINVDDLKPGEGRVGVVDGEHVAVCRTKDGQLHLRKPTCVHMGGIVHWNSVEQTWDCPVHGGRYTNCGHRLYGPPSGDLEKSESAK